MAVKIERKASVFTDNMSTAEKLELLVISYISRFDTISVYANALEKKLEDFTQEYMEMYEEVPLTLHLKAVKQLIKDILNQVDEALEKDLKGEF